MDLSEIQNIAEGAVEVYNANTRLHKAATDLVKLHNINLVTALIAIYAIDRYMDQHVL